MKKVFYLSIFILTLFMSENMNSAYAQGPNPFGTITNPLPAGPLGSAPGAGLITLLNNLLRLVFTVAGIFTFFKILIAGLGFINAGGDAKKIESSWNGIWEALMGMVIVIASIAAGALMGLIFYGDATAILNPKIYGPGP